MMKAGDVRKDLEELRNKGEKVTLADVVHALRLLNLQVLDMKQNQVAIMKHEGIALTTQKDVEAKDSSKIE